MIARNLIIVGGGGQANVIIDAMDKDVYENIYIEDPHIFDKKRYGVEIVDYAERLNLTNLEFIIALGDNYSRYLAYKSLLQRFGEIVLATIVHPTAYISKRAKIGKGSVVCGGVFVGPETVVGKGVILNTNCSVDHDCCLSNFVSVGPNAVLGGNVEVGERSVIAISTTISNNVIIGCDNIIGANSFVHRSIDRSREVWFGSPARKIRSRGVDEKYL